MHSLYTENSDNCMTNLKSAKCKNMLHKKICRKKFTLQVILFDQAVRYQLSYKNTRK